MNYNSPYKSIKSFVPFCQPAYYSFKKEKEYQGKKEKEYRGSIDLEIICCTDIYIGSGFSYMPENSSEFVYRSVMFDGKPIIPGSSLKGVVRNMASAASNGCIPSVKAEQLPSGITPIKCSRGDFCIVCDMFGTMGKGSKVIFSDMHSDNAVLQIRKMNAQYTPKNAYTDDNGVSLGYKFYYTGENHYEMPNKVNVQVVKKGAVFKGRVHFKKLTEEQLSLLMFSLGLDETEGWDIHLKIGGFKNEGIGEVQVRAAAFSCEGMKKTPSALAAQYFDMPTANTEAIDKICCEILYPR